VKEVEAAVLPEAIKQQIDHWVAKYPADQKQSAVIPALHIVQEQLGGYLTSALMAAVADYLEMPRVAVYEVASFYSMYEHKPVGKHKINVCTNVSCMLKGSDKIVEHLQNRLNIKMGQTTADGQFTLKQVECMAACIGAPMFQIDKQYYENLTPEKIDQILSELQAKK
jgi:NADH-quinone oxidoreductase subunit E